VAVNVHTFATTREAYNASQVREDIRDGDVLVVAREGVIGILYRAWPCAITTSRGDFHGFEGDWRIIDGGAYEQSFARALSEQSPRMRAMVPHVVVHIRRGDRVREIGTRRTGTVTATFSCGAIARVRWDGARKDTPATDIGTIRLVPADQPTTS
jgi:hypothetical protein